MYTLTEVGSHLEIEPVLLSQDMWKQLKHVTIPTFSGDKDIPKLEGCLHSLAPATAEYKLLQLHQCLTGDALRAIQNLGPSAFAYEAVKDRLERKFGSQRRQIAMYLEEIDNFKPVHPGNLKDIERYADLLDVTIVNLKEVINRTEELKDGMMYLKLQKKTTSFYVGFIPLLGI